MKLTFYASDKPREFMLAEALKLGCARLGDTLEIRRTQDYGEDEEGNDKRWPGPDPETDVACVFGVKGQSKRIMNDHRAMRKGVLFFDKGYTREKGEAGHTLYSRVSVNDTHPLAYMMGRQRKPDRWNRLKLDFKGWRPSSGGGHVLLCASSQKYHDFHILGDVTDWAAKVAKACIKEVDRQVVYRPKPSWPNARPIPFASFSRLPQPMDEALRGAWCVVTHGSTAAMDGILRGVPAIVLGDAITKPISGTEFHDLNSPPRASDDDRLQWGANMAYCQWSANELRSGEAWKDLREELERQR